ncbi:MAG: cell division protease FtsH, partial [Actinomycetota bacterium]|nr:cell division protease FtsH [Actinomycetota bacterium]
MNKVVKSTVVYVLVAIVGLFLLAKALTASPGRQRLDTLEYSKLVDAHQVSLAKLYDRDHVIKGELKDGKKFELKFPDRYTDEITDLTVKGGVNLPVDNQKDSLWVTLLFNFAPFVLIIAVIAFFMNQAQGGGNRVMSFGKARPKIVNKDTPKVTFAD